MPENMHKLSMLHASDQFVNICSKNCLKLNYEQSPRTLSQNSKLYIHSW